MCAKQIPVNVGSLRFFHVNVNCSDLERSLGFYRDLVGLRTAVRTRPEQPQPGGAFGLAQVQWDAWIMAGDDAPDGVVLDLLEWKVAVPSGSPPASLTELGFGRLCILSDDLAGLHRRLSEAGHDVWSPPGRLGLGVKNLVDAEMFLCSDPDGIAVLFVQGEDYQTSRFPGSMVERHSALLWGASDRIVGNNMASVDVECGCGERVGLNTFDLL